MYKRILSSLLIILFLSGCTLFSPVKVPPTKLYVIDSAPQPPVKKTAHKLTIIVTKPETSAVFNTTQMAYTLIPHQIAYFARNRWAETPSDMMQPIIILTLQRTQHFFAVSAKSAARRHHFILNTQILELQQEFKPDGTSCYHFVMRAQIVNAAGTVIASRQFTVLEPTHESTPYGGVVAANIASAKILYQLAQFCLLKIPARFRT